MEKTKEKNQIFNYLYALAIIMVIDDHTSSSIGILTSIFPYNSFYMPLFVFISGYFYKRRGIKENLEHKLKKFLIPSLIWNIVAIMISAVLDYIFGINWLNNYSIKDIIISNLFYGPTTSINGAAWFVIMLFWVSTIYNIIHYKLKDNKLIDVIATVIYIVLGFVAVYLSIKKYNAINMIWLFALKIAFYIQFYHLGTIFKKYIEKPILKCNKIVVCGICVLINVILISVWGKRICFVDTSLMSGFTTWVLPIITSITGIIFYYEIMDFLSRKIGQNTVIDFVSRNTFVILETHLLFINIPNFYVYLQILNGSTAYNNFNIAKFINNAWLRYSSNTRLLGFFLGLIGSLLIAFIIEKVKNSKTLKQLKQIETINDK